MLPGMELMNCPDLAVPMDVMRHVVHIESSFNPYAIGVVGGRLQRQPRNLPEALATVRMLESRGFNFSLGLAQVNRFNLARYGLGSYEQAFQACPNLQAGSRILAECYRRSGDDWGKSFSCYYSGNFVTGFRHGYVQKVFASMGQPASAVMPTGAIPVSPRAGRRSVPVATYPLRQVVPLVERRGAPDSSAVPATASAIARGPASAAADSPAAGADTAAPSQYGATPPDAVTLLGSAEDPPRPVPAAPAIPATSGQESRDSAFVF